MQIVDVGIGLFILSMGLRYGKDGAVKNIIYFFRIICAFLLMLLMLPLVHGVLLYCMPLDGFIQNLVASTADNMRLREVDVMGAMPSVVAKKIASSDITNKAAVFLSQRIVWLVSILLALIFSGIVLKLCSGAESMILKRVERAENVLVMREINHLIGFLLGIIFSLVFIWIAMLLIAGISEMFPTPYICKILESLEQSKMFYVFYNCNPLLVFLK